MNEMGLQRLRLLYFQVLVKNTLKIQILCVTQFLSKKTWDIIALIEVDRISKFEF